MHITTNKFVNNKTYKNKHARNKTPEAFIRMLVRTVIFPPENWFKKGAVFRTL